MSSRILLLVLLVAAIGCKDKKGNSDELRDSSAVPTTSIAQTVQATDGSYSLELPARWFKLFRVDSLSSAERGTARPGALNIVYLPRDTTQIPQTLVVVAVYDSIAWKKVKAEGGPPPGDSVTAQNGRVYVLALPQSNPFTPGSVDAIKFDSLELTASERSRLLQLHSTFAK